MSEPETIAGLREQLERVDAQLLTLAATRIRLGRAVGEAKARDGLPTVDYGQERAVLARARRVAEGEGLDASVAEDLLARLIRASVTAQEADRVRQAGVGSGKRAVVVGGAGRMGRWFVRFLADAGYRTAVLDPAASPQENDTSRAQLADADLVLCATPPRLTAELYETWCGGPPRGVVADIASIKTPLIGAITRLRAAGARVASLHPMFGPATVLLRDADVVVCDTGDADALRAVEALFAPTTARLVRLPLDAHDRVMADLLALAHAAAIGFAAALPDADHPVRSTTFQALERIAADAVAESPAVYFEIQAANPHAAAAVDRLRGVLARFADAVARGDTAAFAALMDEGKRHTGGA
ncbi:MAG TPA: prephenate dehydrogenase/arogenate dehydrogenase family protein [Gemmatimonadales bacterium]|jgi:chorismate mutase/prephenate dehydrogenase